MKISIHLFFVLYCIVLSIHTTTRSLHRKMNCECIVIQMYDNTHLHSYIYIYIHSNFYSHSEFRVTTRRALRLILISLLFRHCFDLLFRHCFDYLPVYSTYLELFLFEFSQKTYLKEEII